MINIDAVNAIEDSHNINPDFNVLALEKRKNMVQLPSQINCENKEGQEIGVDLNRNWGVDFQPSNDACSEFYPGTKAFSEKET